MAASAMAHDTSVPRVVGLTTAVCHGPPTQASVPVLTRIELRLRKWREGTPDLGGGVGGDVQARAGHSSYQNERALAIFHGDVIQPHRALDLWASRGPYITAMLGLQVVCSYPTPTVGVV